MSLGAIYVAPIGRDTVNNAIPAKYFFTILTFRRSFASFVDRYGLDHSPLDYFRFFCKQSRPAKVCAFFWRSNAVAVEEIEMNATYGRSGPNGQRTDISPKSIVKQPPNI